MPTTYSVWDPRARVYDYFVSPEQPPLGPPDPKHLSGRPALGITPQRAAWPLPMGARRVGRGEYAKGYIAETASSRAMGDYGGGFGTVAGLAAVLGVWFFATRRAR